MGTGTIFMIQDGNLVEMTETAFRCHFGARL